MIFHLGRETNFYLKINQFRTYCRKALNMVRVFWVRVVRVRVTLTLTTHISHGCQVKAGLTITDNYVCFMP